MIIELHPTRPDVRNIVPLDEVVDPVGLGFALYRYTVHTKSPKQNNTSLHFQSF